MTLPFDLNDFPSCGFEDLVINSARGLNLAQTGVVGLDRTDIETLG